MMGCRLPASSSIASTAIFCSILVTHILITKSDEGSVQISSEAGAENDKMRKLDSCYGRKVVNAA